MFKSRKRIRLLVLVTAFLMLLTMILPCGAAYEQRVGNCFYRATTLSPVKHIQPLYNTQAQHTKGYTTTIHVSTSVTKTESVDVTLTIGFSYFVEANTSLGVTQSESFTVEAGVAYTIDPIIPTAMYRISVRFPGHSVRYEVWDYDEQERLEWEVVDYMPDRNASAYFLEEYA